MALVLYISSLDTGSSNIFVFDIRNMFLESYTIEKEGEEGNEVKVFVHPKI